MNKDTVVSDSQNWDIVITGNNSGTKVNLKELWRYRDLLSLFVKRDVITVYKQTILGPIWFVIQPILTTITYMVVFGNIANIGTDGVPMILFYLIGITLWGYFSDTLNITSKTFTENAGIFGKVYFPRLILPLSKVASGLLKFAIQFMLFFVAWLYFWIYKKAIHPNIYILITPLLVGLLALMSLGFGILITSMTTKYRDMVFLITFGVQLMMYATPVIYPFSKLASSKWRIYVLLNPLTSIFEAFKYAFIGKGFFSPFWLVYSLVFTLMILVVGVITFNKVEKRFVDTV